jgi:hypothetical protein
MLPAAPQPAQQNMSAASRQAARQSRDRNTRAMVLAHRSRAPRGAHARRRVRHGHRGRCRGILVEARCMVFYSLLVDRLARRTAAGFGPKPSIEDGEWSVDLMIHFWETVGVSDDAGAGTVEGPICPNCRSPLRETVRSETIAAVGGPESPPEPISVTYCGSCGWTLAASLRR